MEVSQSKPVRFTTILSECGRPTLYLPLSDPKRDPRFMQAAKQHRVLSIKQDPVSQQKDFGAVGFLEEKFVTYLVFKKSLKPFVNTRVVGIKYDVLAQADVAGSGGPASAKKVRKARKTG